MFDDLYKAGILYYNAEELVKKIHLIFEDPMKWWNEKNIQAVRRNFCITFANKSPNFINKLKKIIVNNSNY